MGQGRDLRSYRYPANVPGRVFHIPNLSGITGMSFSPNGASLFVTTTAEELRRAAWPKKSLSQDGRSNSGPSGSVTLVPSS